MVQKINLLMFDGRCMLFCLPGIYVALTGLGAGGGKPESQTVAASVNAILYGVFFLTGWFSGTVMNLIGPNYTMFLGSIGYSLYTGNGASKLPAKKPS